ncbi:MAG: glycosyltransferase family 2 protein [Ktedonobacteraceae bacterium]
MDDMNSALPGGIAATEIGNEALLPSRPLVSVVMTAYLHEKYLADAIAGVLAQKTDFDYELLIGEDCSPDQTRDIALALQERHPDRLRLIYGPVNIGGLRNSRRLIKAARGEFIAFCEGDDYWHHPEKLKMQAEAMTASPDITLCHSDYDRKIGFRVKRNFHRHHRTERLAKGEAYVDLLHAWTVMTATAMYRTDILKDFLSTKFNNLSWPFGDYSKALYASVRGSIAYVPVSTATWRKRMGSATNSGYDNFLRMAMAYAECRDMFMREFPVASDIEHSVRRESHERIMKRAFYAGNSSVFENSYRWLSDNGYQPSNHEWMRFVMNNSLLLSTVREGRALIQKLGTLGG